jgi:hypothetical protein
LVKKSFHFILKALATLRKPSSKQIGGDHSKTLQVLEISTCKDEQSRSSIARRPNNVAKIFKQEVGTGINLTDLPKAFPIRYRRDTVEISSPSDTKNI